MKIVVIGDFHIPSRADKIPDWIARAIEDEKPDMILCTGDFENQETLDLLKGMAQTKAVQGNMDWLDLPQHEELEAGSLKIGLIHGTGISPRGDREQLLSHAKRIGAHILVNGHTHRLRVEKYEGTLLINPGSATGAWGGSAEPGDKSFIIIETNGKIVLRTFINGEEGREEYEL